MTGTCKYCGQEIMVSEDMTTEEERNEAATENCTCYGATEQEKRKRQIEKAEKNIERLFNAEPELADIMRGSVN